MYARRDMVAVYYHNHDNYTLASSGKYTHNAYKPFKSDGKHNESIVAVVTKLFTFSIN